VLFVALVVESEGEKFHRHFTIVAGDLAGEADLRGGREGGKEDE